MGNNKNHVRTQSTFQAVSFSGPLPTAVEFEKYNRALPGAAERILTIAEKEVEHRHAKENEIIKSSVKLGGRGQVFGFIVSLLSIGLVFAAILINQPFASIVPAIIAFTGMASIFINRKK